MAASVVAEFDLSAAALIVVMPPDVSGGDDGGCVIGCPREVVATEGMGGATPSVANVTAAAASVNDAATS